MESHGTDWFFGYEKLQRQGRILQISGWENFGELIVTVTSGNRLLIVTAGYAWSQLLWLERNCRISVAPGVHFLKWCTYFVPIKIDYIKDMNGVLLVPQHCFNEIWISISALSAWKFRGSRYHMQGQVIASHSIPWDARWLIHTWDTCFW